MAIVGLLKVGKVARFVPFSLPAFSITGLMSSVAASSAVVFQYDNLLEEFENLGLDIVEKRIGISGAVFHINDIEARSHNLVEKAKLQYANKLRDLILRPII